MKHFVRIGGVLLGLGLSMAEAQTVQPCANPAACAQLLVGSAEAQPGGRVNIPVSFRQGPSNGQAGGPDEIAALAFSLQIGSSLQLADCSLDADGVPAAIVKNPALANFRLVIENASCSGGRTRCLCPGPGNFRDTFLNAVVYGPNPLPTPGPSPVEIPILPAGPQELFRVSLDSAGTTGAQIPLHVITEWTDNARPEFTAFLSVGDRLAVDQTCVPVAGQPPCSAAGATSQVAVTDGLVSIAGSSCVGDCNGDGEVTVNEILRMVNIALDAASLAECPVGDENGDGSLTINEILKAVNNALGSCVG